MISKIATVCDQILEAYFKLGIYVSILIIILATLFITAEILVRLLFNMSFQIVMQFSGFSLFIITFLSAGWVLREKSHIIVDFFISKLTKSIRKPLELIIFIVCALLCFFLFWESGKYVIAAWERGLTTQYPLRVQTAYILLVMPVGWFSLGLEFLLQFWKEISGQTVKDITN